MRRFFEPQPVTNLGWVLAAGLIGSAAWVADGAHARADGFTSLAVVLGVVGIWLGFPLADPLVALRISIAIPREHPVSPQQLRS